MTATSIQMTAKEVYGIVAVDNEIDTTCAHNDDFEVIPDNIIQTTPNEVYGVSTDGIQTTPNEVYGVSTAYDGIEMTPNEVYLGLSNKFIEI